MYIDLHEPNIIRTKLLEKGVELEVKKLVPGDYIIGKIGIERKTLQDFFSSMVKKRLFEQLKRLKDCYPSCLLILEGNLALINSFSNPGAFWGAFCYITLDLDIPIFFSPTKTQTALLLYTIYRRVCKETSPKDGLRFKPKLLTPEEKQEFLVEGLPNVGEKLSKVLLERFGTVRKVYQATKKDLETVAGIGEKIAKEITELLDRKYKSYQKRL
jgi:ERCC4-type nuclease